MTQAGGLEIRAGVDRTYSDVGYALVSGADGWMFDGEDASTHRPA